MSFSGQRILVTGGHGFIGRHLVARLVAEGADVVVIDHAAAPDVLPARVWSHRGRLRRVLARQVVPVGAFDVVFHLAGTSSVAASVLQPERDLFRTTGDALALFEAIRRALVPPRLVLVSSAAVYGDPVRLPIHESDPTVPVSPYGVARLATERYAAVYATLHGLPVSIVRPFSVYGPGQTKQIVYELLTRIRRGDPVIELAGDGTEARDLVHVGDVAEGLLRVARHAPARGEAFNLGSGVSTRIVDLARELVSACGSSAEVRTTGRARPADPKRWQADVGALTALGWAPRIGLERGLASTRDWYDRTLGDPIGTTLRPSRPRFTSAPRGMPGLRRDGMARRSVLPP